MLGNDLKVTNIIKSAYNKDRGFVNREINAGHLLYDKKNPMEFRPHRASIAQVFPPSDIDGNINQENENVNSKLYQKAYAGSRVDYDRPSLEAIGSGGGQVHGWGLYYALNKDVAERYRETFKRDNVYEIEEVKEKIEELGKDKAFNYYKEKAEKIPL